MKKSDDEDQDAGVAAGEPRPPAEIARGDVHRAAPDPCAYLPSWALIGSQA